MATQYDQDHSLEPFIAGQTIVWHQGEDMGETMALGTIAEVIGQPL